MPLHLQLVRVTTDTVLFNLARYVTTLATSGTCYNLTLIDKITDYDGNVIMENHAEVNNQVELSSDIWNTIHTGMNLAAGTYSAFSSLKMSIAAKTGTAQEKRTTDPDHATLISYAPYDNPTILYGSAYSEWLCFR